MTALLFLHLEVGRPQLRYSTPLILMSICRSPAFLHLLRSWIGAMGMMPALFTRTSTQPKLATAPLISASTSTRFVTSTANPIASPPALEISHRLPPRRSRFLRRWRSQYGNLRPLGCKKLRSALSQAAAGASDYYDLVCNI